MSLRILQSHVNRITEMAKADPDREIVGIISSHPDGTPGQLYPLDNVHENPEHSYTVSAHALYEVWRDMEIKGTQLCAIYHSHPNTEPVPSSTDEILAFYPDANYLICGRVPINISWRDWQIKGYRLVDGKFEQVGLEII